MAKNHPSLFEHIKIPEFATIVEIAISKYIDENKIPYSLGYKTKVTSVDIGTDKTTVKLELRPTTIVDVVTQAEKLKKADK